MYRFLSQNNYKHPNHQTLLHVNDNYLKSITETFNYIHKTTRIWPRYQLTLTTHFNSNKQYKVNA